jgi:hypothetical protein
MLDLRYVRTAVSVVAVLEPLKNFVTFFSLKCYTTLTRAILFTYSKNLNFSGDYHFTNVVPKAIFELDSV